MSFSALNWAVTKSVLDRELESRIESKDPDVSGSATKAKPEIETQIRNYSVVAGFLAGPWGLILPFVVKDRIFPQVAAQVQSTPSGPTQASAS